MSYFLKILHEANLNTINQLRESKNNLQQEGTRARIFDEFPCLLPKENIETLGLELREITNNIIWLKQLNYRYYLANPLDEEKIRVWHTKVILMGCTELLNEYGDIKPEIVNILEWNVYLTRQAICDILTAYVSAINQEIFKDYCNQEPHVLSAILHFITENYDVWTADEFKKSSFQLPTFEVEDGPQKNSLKKIAWNSFSHFGLFSAPTAIICSDSKENEYKPDAPSCNIKTSSN